MSLDGNTRYLLLNHSCFSFLQGVATPESMVVAAREAGYRGAALTDFDGFYGLPRFYKAHQNLLQEGEVGEGTFKAIYGVEVLLDYNPTALLMKNREIKKPSYCDRASKTFFHYISTSLATAKNTPVFLQNRLCYLVSDYKSYEELCTLISFCHRDNKIPTPLSLFDPCVPFSKNSPAILPQRGFSQLFSPQETYLFHLWLEYIKTLRDLHQGNFYLALTPPSTELEKNAFLNHLQASKLLQIPLVATDDVFFVGAQQKIVHDALTAIRLNSTLEEARWACFQNSERYMHTALRLTTYFKDRVQLDEALRNNTSIGEKCNFSLQEIIYQYPSEFIPANHTAFSFLKMLVENKMAKRYGTSVPPQLKNLVEHELKLVEELKFADYFLTVWDIVQYAARNRILYQGRGSAANSAVCFLLNITAVDPLISDVLFERFISRERGEPPDIDVDFEHERREEIIQYIYKRYGITRAAMVANVIRFKTRSALRSVGKILGFTEAELGKLFPSGWLYANAEQTLTQALVGIGNANESHESQGLLPPERVEHLRANLELWCFLAESIRNLPHHLGIHSGGFIISQFSLMKVVPVEPATMANRFVVQWNKDDIENLNIFKIDLLALGMLTALRKTFASLNAAHKRVPGTLIPFSLKTIPKYCAQTYELIQKAKTTGVFQIESRAQMSLLPRLKPNCFYDIVISVGIIRPGPIVSGMLKNFLRRRLQQEPVTIPHKKLVPILQRTLGVPIFQEQVMRIAMAVADFSPGEADELRRSMGAWKLSGDIRKFEEKLRKGMKKNGIADEFANIIYKQIEGFSQYGFPESHATSFAFLAYASAWLKTHFPADFLCGLLNSQPLGFYSPHSLIQEAQHNHVKILKPCLVNSEFDSVVTRAGHVQLGFRMLGHLQKKHVEEFLNFRRKLSLTQYSSENDIYFAISCFNSLEQITLALSGAFDIYSQKRKDILWKILARPSYLVKDVMHSSVFTSKKYEKEIWDNMQDELKTMGTNFQEHPVAFLKKYAWPYQESPSLLIKASELASKPHNSVVHAVGLVIVRQKPLTAKGFVFFTLEDETGTINLVCKPKTFDQYKGILLFNDLIFVKGKLENLGAPMILISEVFAQIPYTHAQAEAASSSEGIFSVQSRNWM